MTGASQLYCVDTAAWIYLHRYFPNDESTFAAVWQELEQLIE